ncbi:MAG: sugar ABC transporter permease [Clostridia bacterium]|nr:sugar ABC transporter permease [Clostridia bacterium]
MKLKRKTGGIEQIKSRYGWLFISTWLIGVVLFFAIPIIQSVIYSFSQMTINADGVNTVWIGLKNYNYVINEHTSYMTWLGKSITNFLYSLPIIVILSLILAILLNQKFRGRLFFRALYFMPVIIATGVVIDLISGMSGSDMTTSSVNESVSGGMFSVQDIIAILDLPTEVATFVQKIISNIFDLIWNSGVQTILFLAGLQSIPATLYEASKVEGATKWEEFWFITFPMLSNVTLLVVVYTMVELFVSKTNPVVSQVYSLMRAAVYDETSAMMWFYFLCVGAIMGGIVLLYKKLLQDRWS